MKNFNTDKRSERVRLNSVLTEKFKMSRISFNFILPKDKITSPLTKLMLSVMMRGSSNYPTIVEINKSLDELYGTNVSYRAFSVGDKSVFRISCKVLDNKYRMAGDDTDILEETLKILSDIIFNPIRDENALLLSEYVESEKKIAIDAIRSQINDQKSYASKQCDRIMLEGTPYGTSTGGDIETVSSFTAKDVTDNIARFMKDVRLECYYIGSENSERVGDLIDKYFMLDGSGESNISYSERALISDKSETTYFCEEMPVSQGRLVMGYRCGVVLSDKESYAMSVFNEILGGSSVSKLFLNVREKKSLCYYCYSTYHSAIGTIKIGCGINPDNKDDAISEIEHQISLMKKGEFDDNEIAVAKRTIISGLRQISDGAASMEAFAFRRTVAGLDESVEECIEKINLVSREQILEAAHKIIPDTVYFLTGNGEEELGDE